MCWQQRRVPLGEPELFKWPLDSRLERYIGLGLGVGSGFVGQRGMS